MSEKQYDVVVCGAGVAGVAAAIAAARSGCKTALIEKQCILGGLATSGLIYVFLPLCDGNGHQVIHGIPEEMLRGGAEYGPFDVAEKWGGPAAGNPGLENPRFICCFSPAGMVLTLDKMLKEAGVDLWLDSLAVQTAVSEGTVTGITVCNTSGFITVKGKCFVDATGGAYMVKNAGGTVFTGENKVTPWVLEISQTPEPFHLSDSLYIRGMWKNASGISLDDDRAAQGFPTCDNGKQITDFVRKTWELTRFQYDQMSSREERRCNYPVTLPGMPQLRKIARIDAEYNLNAESVSETYPDSIGRVGDWRKSNSVWDTPYRALIPRGLKNIAAAGRCIGAADDAWEVYRVIPAAAMTGEAAGVAAALAARKYEKLSSVESAELQKQLCQIRKR